MRKKVCLDYGPEILNMVETHITYTKMKAGIIFSITTWTSFILFTLSFFLIIFSGFQIFQHFNSLPVKVWKDQRRAGRVWKGKNAEAKKRCLKYVKGINNPTSRREVFVVNQGIHLGFAHRKNPEAECCLLLQLCSINKREARWQPSSSLLHLIFLPLGFLF